ncbi:MAG: ferrous iron transporter B, partial [candidate division Zixibacteria bacterium]|nr:ferrous iron transporter B [candidate division Zixibacteria bacterium]
FNLQGLVLTALYLLGLVVAIGVSFILKTIIKSEQSTFMMEMPSYKMPTLRAVATRVLGRTKSFLKRAGTLIAAITIVIWALSYYPHSDEISADYAAQYEAVVFDDQYEANRSKISNEEAGAHLTNSYFGRLGRVIEPLFEPLGWDWKITLAALASFPAREVVVATLGTIYNLGSETNEESSSLVSKLRGAVWDHGDKIGQPVFSPAVAISIMVFFALCCQCGATLVTIKQETGKMRYPVFVFVYMTTLAYAGSWLVYKIFDGMGL